VAHFQSSPAWNHSSGPSHAKWYSQQSQINPSMTDYLGLSAQRFPNKKSMQITEQLLSPVVELDNGHYSAAFQPFQCNFHPGNVLHPTPELVNWPGFV
jgi:hypothetical protein